MLLGLGGGSVLPERCSHLQRETQSPRLRDGLLFAQPPSQMVYGAGITPQPEKFAGTARVLEGTSNRPGPSLRDCPQSAAPARARLLTARAPPARTAPCREQRGQETGLLRPPRSRRCRSALQVGDRSTPASLPDFAPACDSLGRVACLKNVMVGGYLCSGAWRALGKRLL